MIPDGVLKERDGRLVSQLPAGQLPIVSSKMSDVKDNTDEENSPREPERGEGKFMFPGGAVYGEHYCIKHYHT